MNNERNALQLTGQRASPKPAQVLRGTRSTNQQSDRRAQLKQISEFTTDYDKKMRRGIFLAILLISFSILCLAIFSAGINITAFFSAIAVVMIVWLVKFGIEFSEEEMRTRMAYRNYLNSFSYQALVSLRRTSNLTDWSKFEIDSYIKQMS